MVKLRHWFDTPLEVCQLSIKDKTRPMPYATVIAHLKSMYSHGHSSHTHGVASSVFLNCRCVNSFLTWLPVLRLIFSAVRSVVAVLSERQRFDGWFNNRANPSWGSAGNSTSTNSFGPFDSYKNICSTYSYILVTEFSPIDCSVIRRVATYCVILQHTAACCYLYLV